jgi:hypothetical protein
MRHMRGMQVLVLPRLLLVLYMRLLLLPHLLRLR